MTALTGTRHHRILRLVQRIRGELSLVITHLEDYAHLRNLHHFRIERKRLGQLVARENRLMKLLMKAS